MSNGIRVALISEQTLLREALESHLATFMSISLACSASAAWQAWQDVLKLKPDVAVVDLSIPHAQAFELVKRFRMEVPEIGLLLLGGSAALDLDEILADVTDRPAMSMNQSLGDLTCAIRAAMTHPRPASTLSADPVGADSEPVRYARLDPGEALSVRELEVLKHLARGESAKGVARLMRLTAKSVENHKYRIMQKLRIHNRVELARYALRTGLVTL